MYVNWIQDPIWFQSINILHTFPAALRDTCTTTEKLRTHGTPLPDTDQAKLSVLLQTNTKYRLLGGFSGYRSPKRPLRHHTKYNQLYRKRCNVLTAVKISIFGLSVDQQAEQGGKKSNIDIITAVRCSNFIQLTSVGMQRYADNVLLRTALKSRKPTSITSHASKCNKNTCT